MSGLGVAGAVVRYEDLVAVDGVDLAVAPGEIVALLGASGSGKSSLLRGIAGLEPLAAGRVCWDGVDLATVPVHKRGFGMLFQDGQLFNHLSVEGNVGYGLFRDSPAVRRERVNGLLELVGLGGYGKRRVSELSGGQAQRVALARSLAPRPRLLMLDEPLSALDRNLREHLVGVLGDALRATRTTALHVTHDQDEAFALGRPGRRDGAGPAAADRPAGRAVEPAGGREVALFLGFDPFVAGDLSARLGGPPGGPGTVVGIGPEALLRDPAGLAVPILEQHFQRGVVLVDVRLPDGQRATVRLPEKVPDGHLSVSLDHAGCVVVPA